MFYLYVICLVRGEIFILPTSYEGKELGEKIYFIFQHAPITVTHLFQRFSNKAKNLLISPQKNFPPLLSAFHLYYILIITLFS
jgi:hypothetical protein